MKEYRAIVSTGQGPAAIEVLNDRDLPEGDVTVEVAYSSLNYKDGLAVTGNGRIARTFPMVCGIDLAGTVVESQSPDWHRGDEVIVTGYGLSERHPGGYAQVQRVRSDWLVRRPAALSLLQAMAFGTAGLTAMLCAMALEDAGVESSGAGEIVVTGASGGVGSVSVAVLSQMGWRVTASTGRAELGGYLTRLGATTCIDRAVLAEASSRPLADERWVGAVDTVGGTTLANVLRHVSYGGAVAVCGLAGGSDVPTTVFPFILRGVRLLGVDSVDCPMPTRQRAWERLARQVPADVLAEITSVVPLDAVLDVAGQILAGAVRGRIVVDVQS